MRIIFLTIIYFLVILSTFTAQDISIFIKGAQNDAELLKLSGEKSLTIDSVSKRAERSYFINNKNLQIGFHRLKFDKYKWLDFVVDGKPIKIKTNADNVLDSIEVVESEANRLYYKFIKLNKEYKTKSDLLQIILARYPKGNKYYKQTKTEMKSLQDEYLNFVYSESQKDPNSFIARYIHSAHQPIVNYLLKPEEQLKELKSTALDNIDFQDEQLINSDAFTNRAIEYLMYYRNPQLPKGLLEKEFMKAIDTLLNKAKVNEAVYTHMTEYLVEGFRKFGFEAVVDYILENYVIKDELCLDAKLENSLQRRLDQAQLLKVGTKAPNISIIENNIKLDKIKAERTLVVFYASWCPHCKELMPQLSELYKTLPDDKLEVIAISLDKEKTEWTEFIKKHKFSWLNAHEPEGWEGKTAESFHVYATPTLFMLDENKNILGKPLKIEEIKAYL